MTYTINSTIQLSHALTKEPTSYSGEGGSFHIERIVDGVSTILTEANGNIFSISDAYWNGVSLVSGSISVDVPVEYGFNRVKLVHESEPNLDAGDVDLDVLARGIIHRINSQSGMDI